jgi:BarA-like signal transduction histidine kinase
MSSLIRHRFLLLLFAACLLPPQHVAADEPAPRPSAGAAFPFEENVGQVPNGEVKYFARGPAETLFVTADGSLVYSFTRRRVQRAGDSAAARSAPFREPDLSDIEGWTLRETFVGSQIPRIAGSGRSSAALNYFKGNDPSGWRVGVPAYDAVELREIYPGIHLSIARRGGRFEKTFTVLPGADHRVITGTLDGADAWAIGEDGALVVTTGLGTLEFTKPVAFQTVAGGRRDVAVRYVRRGSGYGFELGDHDPTAAVVIDPLLASTFLGASNDEGAYAVAVDAHGSVYVAGYTYSSTFPTTTGAHDRSFAGPSNRTDAFISQFTSSLTQLVSSTFVGGNGPDWINDLFCWRDSTTGTDYVFATGLTGSTDFPTTSGAYDRQLATDIPDGVEGHDYYHQDAFVIKFTRNLDAVSASTLLGGDAHDAANSLYVTREGNVYVTGWSDPYGFPTTPGAYYRTANMTPQAFVSKLNVGLTSLLASTYLGQTERIRANAVFVQRTTVSNQAVDYVYVAGEARPSITSSYPLGHPDDFPTTDGAFDETFNGGNGEGDAFVSKFDANLQTLLASTFLGGSSNESAWGLLVNADNTVFVAGYTSSSGYPTTPGAFDTDYSGGQDAFISRLDANLQRLVASTFLGGTGREAIWSIDRDRCGHVHVTGDTTSAGGFPNEPDTFTVTHGAPDETYNGGTDAFLAMFDRTLELPFFSTFVGLQMSPTSATSLPYYVPAKADAAFSVAVDNIRNAVYIAGYTESGTVGQSPVRKQPRPTYQMFPVLPIPVEGQTAPQAYDITFNGGEDAFASKYGMLICRWGQADVNGDGVTDIVWRNTSTGDNYVWLMNGTTRIGGLPIERLADKNWKIEGVADFNGDGLADLVWRNWSTGANSVWYMNGATHSGNATLSTVADLNWQIGAVADFNSDGQTDILWRNYSTGENSLWLMNGVNHSGSVAFDKQTDPNWKIVAAGDMNGDGFTDIVWRNTSNGQNAVWYYSDTARTGTAYLDSVSDQNWKIVLLADFNSDGQTDILWRNASTGENTVWFMSDTTRTSTAALEKVPDVSWIVATQLEGTTTPPVTSAVTVTITSPTTSPTTTATSPFAGLGGSATSVNPLARLTWTTDRGSSGVGAFTTAATATGARSWKADIPLFAGSNLVTITATDVMGVSRTDTITVTASSFVYTLAEGATGAFFDLELLLANPNATAAPVTIQYLKEDGSTVSQSLTLAAKSRQTVLVDGIAGLTSTAVSAVVTSSNALPLAVERTMTWDASGYGAHTEKATMGASLTWYFAEGSEQPPFDTYLLLANPQTTSNRATVQFLVEGGSPITKVYDLLPTSRTNVYTEAVESPPGTKALLNRPFGIVVTFDQPGVAERAMYFGAAPFWNGGHESAGVTEPSTSWFHAEGATGTFFDTYLLLSNPNSTPAAVTLRYLLDSGATVVRTKTVAANARLTVAAESEDPLLADAAMATEVTSNVPIVSERAMYWAQYPNWYEAHNAFGVTTTGVKWALGEGRVGGSRAYETYILLANPGETAATVTVTFLREGGLAPIVQTYAVAPTSRFNVYANGVPGLQSGERFGALIESTEPIAVERAMYSNASSQPGLFWAAGTNATATPIP